MEKYLRILNYADIASVDVKDEIEHIFKIAKIHNPDNTNKIVFRVEDFSPYDYSKKGHLDNTTGPSSRVVFHHGRP